MKKYLATLTVLFLVLGFSGIASATAILPASGEFMFEMAGNDPNDSNSKKNRAALAALEAQIEAWFADSKGMTLEVDLDYYAKVNAPGTGDGDLSLGYNGDSRDSQSGTWTAGTRVDFYSVKAGRGYALYWLEGGAASGDWNTEHREWKGISHLTTWVNTGGHIGGETPTTATPEPGTIALLGFGLIGLAGVRRKFKK